MAKTPDPPRELTLAGIHDGAALELWQNALEHVVANMTDPNTSHRDKRRIRLDFEFTSNEDRNVGDVRIVCSTKLAGHKGVDSVVFLGRHEGRTIAVEQPRQENLFPAPGGELLAMPGGKAED